MNAGFMNIPKDIPLVQIHTTSGRGSTPEEVAARCADKLMYVAENAPPAIKDQALAFKAHMEKLIAIHMREAIASDRTTVYNAIKDAGRPDLAEMIRRI